MFFRIIEINIWLCRFFDQFYWYNLLATATLGCNRVRASNLTIRQPFDCMLNRGWNKKMKTINEIKKFQKSRILIFLYYSIKYILFNYRTSWLLDLWSVKYISTFWKIEKIGNIMEFLVAVRPIVNEHKMFRFCPECLL